MDVVESGKIRILMRKSCFPEIVPNVASRCIVQLVNPFWPFSREVIQASARGYEHFHPVSVQQNDND